MPATIIIGTNHKPHFDAADTAREIITRHTEAYLQGCHAEYESNRNIMDSMYEECSFILTGDLLEGKLTPMQYADVRNELGSMIWKIFEPYVNAEDEAEHLALLASPL